MICGRKSFFLLGLFLGCFYIPPPTFVQAPPAREFVPPPPPMVEPPPAAPAGEFAPSQPVPRGQFAPPPSLKFGLGAGTGFMLVGGDVGPGVEIETTLWFNDEFGIRLSAGHYRFDDPWYDEEVTIEPLLVTAVFSTPRAVGPAYRKTFGIGTGAFRVDEAFTTPYDVEVFFIAGGAEWLYRRGRLYTSADLYFVSSAGEYYSLGAALGFRFGYEASF